MKKEKEQNKVFAVGFLLIAFVISWFLLKPFILRWKNGQENLADQKINEEILKAPSIMADELYEKIERKSKIYFLDISSEEDFRRGHLAKAINIRAELLGKDFFDNIGIDQAAEIFLINQGNDLVNLAVATNKVIADGFVNAKYLRGGIADWREQGYPLVSLGGSEDDSAKVKKITIDEIKIDASMNQNALQFLDVRDRESFSKEHIVGALNIPLSQIEVRQDEIPFAKKVVVYGADDQEGYQAVVALFDLNFFNAHQMQGTVEDWVMAGGNTEK